VHTARFERPPSLAGQTKRLDIPGGGFENQLGRPSPAGAGLALPIQVIKRDFPPLQNGLPQQGELSLIAAAAPRGKVRFDPALLRLAKKSAQPGQGLLPSAAGYAEIFQSHQHLTLLLGGEQRFVQSAALHQRNPASGPSLCADGRAPDAEGFDIPINGADRNLQLLRQLPGRHAPPLGKQI
jgi:hypothetical protein